MECVESTEELFQCTIELFPESIGLEVVGGALQWFDPTQLPELFGQVGHEIGPLVRYDFLRKSNPKNLQQSPGNFFGLYISKRYHFWVPGSGVHNSPDVSLARGTRLLQGSNHVHSDMAYRLPD